MSLYNVLSGLNTLHNIKNKATVLAAELKSDLLKFRNSDFLNAAMAGSALIALADGTISAEEKQKMIGFIEHNDALSVFSTHEVIAAFQNFVSTIEFDAQIGNGKAYCALAKIKNNSEAARLVMRLIISIASADGDFDAREKTVAVNIARELNLNPEDFNV
jgi:tellurite resistance protein TerB